MEHQGHDNEDKDAPEEQNESNHEVGSGKKADEQVSAKEEDQQNQPQVHPTGIPGAVGGEHVMGGADEEDIAEDVPDHKRCSQKDQCRNHMTHEKTGTSSFDGICLGDGVENGLGKMEKASCKASLCYSTLMRDRKQHRMGCFFTLFMKSGATGKKGNRLSCCLAKNAGLL